LFLFDKLMRNTLVLFLLLNFLNACKEDVREINLVRESPRAEFMTTDATDSYALTPQAQELVRTWQELEDLMSESRNIKGSTLGELRNKSEIMSRYSDSLTQRIPSEFDTQIIKSRLMVVKTRSKLLYQELHVEQIDSLAVSIAINELKVALNNLILQLNEKLEKDRIDALYHQNEKEELNSRQLPDTTS